MMKVLCQKIIITRKSKILQIDELTNSKFKIQNSQIQYGK